MHRKLPTGVVALAIVLSIGLGAAWPFFRSPGLPANTDAELHIYRTAELGYSLEAGLVMKSVGWGTTTHTHHLTIYTPSNQQPSTAKANSQKEGSREDRSQ